MTGSVKALFKYLLLGITLAMLGFSVGCNDEKKQQKKSKREIYYLQSAAGYVLRNHSASSSAFLD